VAEPERCPWCLGDDLMVAYHDHVWGVPVHDDRALFEKLILDGFQAGLSWRIINRKTEGFRAAYEGFDPVRIASWGPSEVAALQQDARIVRNKQKIEASIANARAWVALREAGIPFDAFLWDFVGGRTIDHALTTHVGIPAETDESRAMSKALQKRGFKFCGPTITYAFMQAVGMVNDHLVSCFRHAQVGAVVKVLVCAVGLGTVGGCLAPCGTYEISDTTALDAEGRDYNGTWREQCGAKAGTSASWDLLGDGNALVFFSPTGPGDRSWQAIDIELELVLDNSRLAPGERFEFGDGGIGGSAALNPCIDCRQDQVGLTGGYVEVLSGFEGDDPCAEEDGPTFKLEWSLEFGGDGPSYVLAATDKVMFSTFLADSCEEPL